MRTNNIVHLNLKKVEKKILRPQYNTTKAQPCNSNRETKEEQNNYQMWLQKKYRNKLTQKQMSGILRKDTIQVSYDKCSEEVQNNIK